MSAQSHHRPFGIIALTIFFLIGSLISFTAGFSLLTPGSFLDPIWRLNPLGHDGLVGIGLWGTALLFAASISCAAAAIGLWRKARWGHVLAITLIAINLLTDIANAVLGTEPRAIVGVPIASTVVLYLLSKRVRNLFKANGDH